MSTSYLTKIEIDHETAFKAGLRDSYSWHQSIWKAFPGKDGQNRSFLTRLDEIDGGLRLLLLSTEAPMRPDWCPDDCWNTKTIPEAFWNHPAYRFSLVANPTKKVRSDSRGNLLKNSRRVPILYREDRVEGEKNQPGLLSWLARKGEQHGFSIVPEQVKTIPRPRQPFIKKGAAGIHAATEFAGVLTVTDPEAFRKAALNGIGPAKAFGFGMLCLSPH